MSRFRGPQGKGALRRHRELLKEEAEARNDKTPLSRRRSSRRGQHVERIMREQNVTEAQAIPVAESTMKFEKRKAKKSMAVQISERGVKG